MHIGRSTHAAYLVPYRAQGAGEATQGEHPGLCNVRIAAAAAAASTAGGAVGSGGVRVRGVRER
jgi:hypothetical protein